MANSYLKIVFSQKSGLTPPLEVSVFVIGLLIPHRSLPIFKLELVKIFTFFEEGRVVGYNSLSSRYSTKFSPHFNLEESLNPRITAATNSESD